MGRIRNLQSLTLRNNKFEGPIPTEIANLGYALVNSVSDAVVWARRRVYGARHQLVFGRWQTEAGIRVAVAWIYVGLLRGPSAPRPDVSLGRR